MIRRSMVARKIDLEEKRVYVPPPMIQEPFFSPHVATAPTIPDIMMSAPIVSPPVVATNENEEPVFQDPIEPIAADEGEQQQPKWKKCQ